VEALVAAGVKKVYAAARNISTLDTLGARHGSRVTPSGRVEILDPLKMSVELWSRMA